jgi:hypothetical protein
MAAPKDRLPAETKTLDYRPELQLSPSPRERNPGVTWGGDGVGNLITRLAIFHSDWSSGSRDSSVALYWSFLHSFS